MSTPPMQYEPDDPAIPAVMKGRRWMHALFITFHSAIAMTELEADFTKYAEALRDGAAPGLISKTWLVDEPVVGGFMLFENGDAARTYLDGMFASSVPTNPHFSDIRIEHFDVVEPLSALTTGLDTVATTGRP